MAIPSNKERRETAAPHKKLTGSYVSMRRAICIAAMLLPLSAYASELTFEVDDNVLVVRGVDLFGSASFEFLGEPGKFYQCVAVGYDGKPIAVTTAASDAGEIFFSNLDVKAVESVKCRTL